MTLNSLNSVQKYNKFVNYANKCKVFFAIFTFLEKNAYLWPVF